MSPLEAKTGPLKMEQAAYQFNPEILREYDIRGEIGKNLSAADAFALGCAFGTYVAQEGGSRICVGYDGRESSPMLVEALIKGLTSTGINVENVGLGPTPMLYFATKDHMADGGIMVTGSHNPPAYNGFKMLLQQGSIYGEAVQDLGKIAAGGNFATGEDGKGSVRELDIREDYVERLLRDFSSDGHPLKIAWDCGNGATGEITRMLTAKLPGEHILLYDDIDPNFPNHHPDPTIDENLTDLIKIVREEQCDLGIAFDGDGDRIGIVDEQGTIIRCDLLLAVYARSIIEERPGAPIIGDVKCSQVMFDEITRMGGKAVMWKTGHSLVKAKMAELKSPLAGELSGHIFFADKYYGFDDGLYCAIRLMNEIVDSATEDINDKCSVSSLFADMPKLYNTPEVRFEVEESDKFAAVERIAASLQEQLDTQGEGVEKLFEIIDIDGVRVTNENGWWLLRASNTQNVLVTRAEANSLENLEKIKNMVIQEVEKTGYSLKFPENV